MSDQPKDKDLVAIRDPETGKFLPGKSGNPRGRPQGSKNRITLMKVALEEAFREETYEDVLDVLRQVVQQAKQGDKASQKMVWESAVSKGIQATDKDAKSDKGFTVHHMHHNVDEEEKADARSDETEAGR